MLKDARIVMYVGGSIAAVKAPGVVTELRRRGAEVRVAMTHSAQRFITPLALRSVSGHPVSSDMWHVADAADDGHGMQHLTLSTWAQVQVCIGASANLIARLALGLADDAVTNTALACAAPLVIAPGMETAMWDHPATQANVATLVGRGAHLVGPVGGRLASGKEGQGRMAEPDDIVDAVEALLKTS